MNESGQHAHMKVMNVFLSSRVSGFITNTPPDDRNLILQDGIDRLIERIAGSEPSPDMSVFLKSEPDMTVFATHFDLANIWKSMPVIIAGRFNYNGKRIDADQEYCHEIAAEIFVGTDPEAEDLISEWQQSEGISTIFV